MRGSLASKIRQPPKRDHNGGKSEKTVNQYSKKDLILNYGNVDNIYKNRSIMLGYL